jgi:putative ABC transport system permease protein
LSLSTAGLSQKLVEWVEKQPHVKMAVGAMTYPISGLTTMTGIDLDRFTHMSGGFRYVAGRPPKYPNEILVDSYYARQNKLRVGSTVKLWNRNWRVSGIFEQGMLARLVMPLATLQDLSGNVGKISQIYAKVDDPDEIYQVIAELKSKLGDNYPIYSIPEFTSLFAVDKVPGLREFIWVIVGVSVAVGFLVVFLSMYTAVLERTREIGILKALGASPVFVLGILIRETVVLAFFGSALGIGFSYVTRWLIMALVPASLTQTIVHGWWPIAGLIALAGALLGAAYPGWRAARQDPIEALSYE